jgi:hypothetical protein
MYTVCCRALLNRKQSSRVGLRFGLGALEGLRVTGLMVGLLINVGFTVGTAVGSSIGFEEGMGDGFPDGIVVGRAGVG